MAKIALPYTMEQDRIANIKANSIHVDANFNTLLQAVNNKIDRDGSIVPSANLSMGNNKIVGLATPTNSGDATTKGYVDALITELRTSITQVKAQATTNANTIVNNLKTMYPVGSVYIGTQSTCPMTSLIDGSVWQLVSSGRALWTGNGSNANTTIAAGLPNITGNLNGISEEFAQMGTASGAFRKENSITQNSPTFSGNGNSGVVSFNASRSSSIYGNSNTVQPPAYVVNVWRRTA